MSDRLIIPVLALLAGLGLLVAPWAAISREVGARSTLFLLPDRIIDFTGRTDAVGLPGFGLVLVVSLVALAVICAGAVLRARTRYLAWLVAGAVVVAVNLTGLDRFGSIIAEARVGAFVTAVERALENPRPNQDVEALRDVVERAPTQALDASLSEAAAAGLVVRRLPYGESGPAFAAFLALAAGIASFLFGLRISPRLGRVLDRSLAAVAVPLISITLALVASGVVILILQPTPMGSGVSPAGPLEYLAGRLDTLWYAYLTLFADSLGTAAGFFEALKFATPLIFTGLALAFGFRAGLFNIGAPGQMVLGAVAAMLVGLYMPGPSWVVVPLAVLASAVGGGLWGALPGWLKARFGANEVINTILLNYVAASLLLFLLSALPTFAAPAWAALRFLGWALLGLIVALLVPPARRLLGRRPRLSAALVMVGLTVGMVAAGAGAQGQPPYQLRLPFKVPGSEPKSYTLPREAQIPQLPRLLGIDTRTSPGVNVVPVDLAAVVVVPVVAILALWLLPRLGLRRWPARLGGTAAAAAAAYGVAALFGLRDVPLPVPPTNLNLSFLIALFAAWLVYMLLWRTKWGYELRAVGIAPKAAEYGGAHIGRNVVLAMTLSGALAGLTATHYVLGGALEDYSLRQSLPTSDGFDGIAVALLGGNNPLGVVLAAFLFGVLKTGGSVLNITFSELTRDVVNMIVALVVLFIAAKGFLPERLGDPLRRRQQLDAESAEPLEQPLDPPGKPVRSEEGS